MTEQDLARRRIEARGLKLPEARAAEILAAAPLMRQMIERVHRPYAYTDEPAVVARLLEVPK